MGAGVFVGIFWGLVVSAFVVTAVSLSAPLPPRQGDAAPVATEEAAADDAGSPDVAGADVAGAGADAEDAPPSDDVATEAARFGGRRCAFAVPPALAALDSAQPGPIDRHGHRGTGRCRSRFPRDRNSTARRPKRRRSSRHGRRGVRDLAARADGSGSGRAGGLDTAPAPQPRYRRRARGVAARVARRGEVTVSDPTAEDEAAARSDAARRAGYDRAGRAAEADVESAAPPAQGRRTNRRRTLRRQRTEPETVEIAESPAPVETAREPDATTRPTWSWRRTRRAGSGHRRDRREAPIGEPDLAPEAQPVDVAEADAGSSEAGRYADPAARPRPWCNSSRHRKARR
jgi:hypothetical protein